MLRRRIFFLFLIALALSHAWRWWRLPPTGPAKPGQETVTLPAFDREIETASGKEIVFAYREFAENPDAPPLVILHGSPGSSSQVEKIARSLAPDYRVILPDLPGFGGSTRKIPDYSIVAHSRYLVALLDELGIAEAHLLGFSLGGGVILHVAETDPARVRSLVMVAAIGVQELELLGDHLLNHGLHGAQLAGLWTAQHFLPHFGAMDDAMLNISYARNFFDSDQRPLRAILESVEAPMLIVHGKDDSLVPYSAAQEHHRIVPQSELVTLDKNHFAVFMDPDAVAEPVRRFLARVDAGEDLSRSGADEERIALAATPFDWDAQDKAISTPVFMMLLALTTLVAEDFACITAGILASKGVLPFWIGVLACFLGIVIGDSLLYFAGRAFGKEALLRKPFCWFVTEAKVEQSAHFFHQYGMSLIFITRFIPGTRLPTYFAAGVLGASLLRFGLCFVLASAIWTPLIVGLSYFVGGRMLAWMQQYEKYSFVGLVAIIFLLWLVIHFVIPLFSWRGRRNLLGRWRRLTRWEFWPPWLFYPPLVIYVLWLGIKNRSFLLFTAANPGIPAGGIAMESKSDILAAFGDAPEIAAFGVIEPDLAGSGKLARLEEILTEKGLSYPVVLKPDIGERGQGVSIIKTADEASGYLESSPDRIVVQEFVPGDEFGVFYYRLPDEEHGRIFSITDKRLLRIVGDGKSTLEELIFRHDRAVCMAPYFLNQLAHDLDDVPASGEFYALSELGTHCRGALFLDGNELLSPELEQTIDRLSKRFDGFYFGRYDIRVPRRDDLHAGRGLKVLELNGVTSEATHIYQPGTSLFRGYRTLMKQWRLAFAIGRANADRGHPPIAFREFLRLLHHFRTKERFEAKPSSSSNDIS